MKTVLILDDEGKVRSLLTRIIRAEGYDNELHDRKHKLILNRIFSLQYKNVHKSIELIQEICARFSKSRHKHNQAY